MSDEEIQAYIASGHSDDKAGAYGIQGSFGAYIKGITGDYYNVVVLPVGRVYQELKNEYPDLSLGTVYRNLTRFKEDGTIRSLGVINGQEHFDGELNAHDHFLCMECGQILDLARPAFLEESIEHLEKTGNLVVRSYDLLLRGTCPACCKKQKQ